ncbi:P-type conjugative transfer protein TrbL [Henriciella mobilis]|uniref:P-type conjugative transfer protein TrbL n=1 Tax=Henriciella mobilis TaxID=2305467 RepID=UPI000E6763D7|nr:P-type conjugative transfer protein TrbL [Henriciella mobilis]RIJ14123.1 P-type conjugative transfer protein TrbL [Henriciella mobilis]RIJ21487.1 P-type conjugative transfer protein TrbL [Henriciella mobilis]
MNDLNVIDQFVVTFSTYIDSGFGLLQADVAFLTTALITIDITLAGLFWAMGPDTDVIGKFLKKVLYVGFFALIIGNFAFLADVIFQSFAQLGLNATGGTITANDIMKPGFVAATGYNAAYPLLDEIAKLTGPIAFFKNFVIIFVLGLAWLITLLAFFFLAIQLFITIIEFKLTTLAGFVLIPFALWNKTSFLAERVLGNVISSGIKLMVLAIIVGIGSTIFGSITSTFAPDAVTLEQASSVILGSLAMLALGIFGPGIATGIVSGAPQLGAGAAIGTAAGVGAGAVAGGSMARGIAGGAGRAASTSIGAAASVAGGTRASYALSSATSGKAGVARVASGAGGVAAAGFATARQSAARVFSRMTGDAGRRYRTGGQAAFAATGGTGGPTRVVSPANDTSGPDWAKRIRRSQSTRDAGMTAAAAVRDGDRPGAGEAPRLRDEED